jgi:hypothetical protein
MAKRHGGKKGRKYKNRKRVAAGKRAYRKSGLYKYNMRRKRGKKRGHKRGKKYSHKGRGGSKKSRKYARKAAAAGVRVPPMSKIHDAYRRIIDRGGSEEHARAVVARLERMRKHLIHKGIEAHEAKEKAEAERKKAAQFADLFRKIGAEEARRASL